MEITIFNFHKRVNSTKQPSGGKIITEVLLKEGTSIYNPSFLLSKSSYSEKRFGYNYLEWNNRYYYIDDVILEREGYTRINCSIDYLATYKEDILNTSAFVIYSTNNYNVNIIDSRLQQERGTIINTYEHSTHLIQEAVYSVCISGKNSHYLYGLNRVNLPQLLEITQENGFLQDMVFEADLGQTILKKYNNIYDCFGGITLLPINPTYFIDDISYQSQIKLGNYTTNIGGWILDERYEIGTFTLNIPWEFDDFRNRSQFTQLYVYLPCYGLFQLNTDDYQNINTITIKVFEDCVNGSVQYLIDNKFKVDTNGGVNIPYGKSTKDSSSWLTGLATSALGVGIASITDNVFMMGGAITSGTNTLLNATDRSNGTTGGGGLGGIAKGRLSCILFTHDTNVEPSSMATLYGRPLYEVIKLSNCVGYVQTSGMNVSANTSREMLDNINNSLNGGVYIE